MDKTMTLTIGRNIGDTPMGPRLWADFRERTLKIATTYAQCSHPIYSILGTSVSAWGTEDTYQVSVPWDTPWRGTPSPRAVVAALATMFYQDCIALTIGPPAELIERTDPRDDASC